MKGPQQAVIVIPSIGARLSGEVDPSLDAEVIDMSWPFFHSLGISLSILKKHHRCRNSAPLSGQIKRLIYSVQPGTLS
jgi:hypothetical protein